MMEKLRSIHQSIVDKEELVRELERAEQEIYQLKLQFEGKLFDLLQEKTEVMKERDEAMGAMQSTNRSEKELESIREQYERRLKGLVEQINTYRQKLADNQKTLKQKVQTEQQLPALKQSVEELRLEKQELIRKIRDEQKTNKSFKEDTTKELKRLVKMDMQKTSYIKQLEKNNETQVGLGLFSFLSDLPSMLFFFFILENSVEEEGGRNHLGSRQAEDCPASVPAKARGAKKATSLDSKACYPTR